MAQFLIPGEVRRGVSKNCYFGFLEGGLWIIQDTGRRVPWESVLKDKGVQEGWTLLKKEALEAQE